MDNSYSGPSSLNTTSLFGCKAKIMPNPLLDNCIVAHSLEPRMHLVPVASGYFALKPQRHSAILDRMASPASPAHTHLQPCREKHVAASNLGRAADLLPPALLLMMISCLALITRHKNGCCKKGTNYPGTAELVWSHRSLPFSATSNERTFGPTCLSRLP